MVEEEIYRTKSLPDLTKYLKLTKEDYINNYNFENLHFMQLWGDCSNLGYLGKDRMHGPIDNVYSVKPENIKLLFKSIGLFIVFYKLVIHANSSYMSLVV